MGGRAPDQGQVDRHQLISRRDDELAALEQHLKSPNRDGTRNDRAHNASGVGSDTLVDANLLPPDEREGLLEEYGYEVYDYTGNLFDYKRNNYNKISDFIALIK